MTRSMPFGIPRAVDDWRDLGGIRTGDGRTIRPGALVRARSLDALSDDGWQAAFHRGVCSVALNISGLESTPPPNPLP